MSRLHWYGPRSHQPTAWLHDPPLRRARYRLYIPDEQYQPDSHQTFRDRDGTYVWIGTDCGWEWLATRPILTHLPGWWRLFDRLHRHVHTPGSW